MSDSMMNNKLYAETILGKYKTKYTLADVKRMECEIVELKEIISKLNKAKHIYEN